MLDQVVRLEAEATGTIRYVLVQNVYLSLGWQWYSVWNSESNALPLEPYSLHFFASVIFQMGSRSFCLGLASDLNSYLCLLSLPPR
jgi:hypothetical protein